ncbi:uncharacterized membrane protein DDB_G0293934 [Nematostella vectensis]|uniref:uncharacterized membrane protein DDB_G0293934 n=1 Tax=Nematostella vectensis TaxID=45351 RepID=UPI00207767C2|nr:uncharacterized membrane protein DDB_G0293934 [Nematostella vectensis]
MPPAQTALLLFLQSLCCCLAEYHPPLVPGPHVSSTPPPSETKLTTPPPKKHPVVKDLTKAKAWVGCGQDPAEVCGGVYVEMERLPKELEKLIISYNNDNINNNNDGDNNSSNDFSLNGGKFDDEFQNAEELSDFTNGSNGFWENIDDGIHLHDAGSEEENRLIKKKLKSIYEYEVTTEDNTHEPVTIPTKNKYVQHWHYGFIYGRKKATRFQSPEEMYYEDVEEDFESNWESLMHN